jgi:hypothetical protein
VVDGQGRVPAVGTTGRGLGPDAIVRCYTKDRRGHRGCTFIETLATHIERNLVSVDGQGRVPALGATSEVQVLWLVAVQNIRGHRGCT